MNLFKICLDKKITGKKAANVFLDMKLSYPGDDTFSVSIGTEVREVQAFEMSKKLLQIS
ncbi:hypothetical protein LAD67_17770 [Escherichia coli]|nr:hypothetical protein [Escherichia coli]